jgi:hypothetical protein
VVVCDINDVGGRETVRVIHQAGGRAAFFQAPGWIGTDEPRQYWESLTPAERVERGVPSRLLTTDEVAEVVVRLADDASLAGRILVWWSEDVPRLIQWGDRGYRDLVDLTTGE